MKRAASALALLLVAPAMGQERDKPPAAATQVVPATDARVAVLGALDKRLGTTAEFTLSPGERFTFGRLSGILRTCEKTQPFERRQSAAFVQIVDTPRAIARGEQPRPRTVFSGWMFAESPSLNPMQHPVYDIWLKSCAMTFPDGPKPPVAAASGKSSPRRARAAAPAPQSAPPASPPPAAVAPEPQAPIVSSTPVG